MLKRYLAVAAVAAFLAGCSSNPAVEGNASGAGTDNSSALGSGSDQNSVASVQAGSGAAESQGPVGVGKVIYFDFDSSAIKPQYQGIVDGQARFLESNGNAHVTLEGNTDARGSREYNLALGQRRADSVRRALELVGASANQIEAVSFGKENPAVSGDTEEAYAQNRRVEFHYR